MGWTMAGRRQERVTFWNVFDNAVKDDVFANIAFLEIFSSWELD
jgi:hypothetical protein